MKRKLIILASVSFAVCCIAVLVFVLIFRSYVSNSKDYKKILSVQEEKKNAIDNQDTPKELKNEVQEKSEESTEKKKAGKINVLFLGIDRTEYRDKTLGVYRTDTISIANIDMDTKKTNVLCIPRDTYAYIPAIDKKDKINHAYVWGGMNKEGIKSTIDTINGFIKYAKIDYYFAIDMEPLPKIVDRLGGVEIDVEIDMKSHGADVSKGFQTLNGDQAFDYIHWRYSGNGDIDRIKRQQKFLKAMLVKLTSSGKILDAINIVLDYNKYIQTNLSVSQIIALAELYKDIEAENVTFYDIPGYDKHINNIWYWIPDEDETDNRLAKVFKP